MYCQASSKTGTQGIGEASEECDIEILHCESSSVPSFEPLFVWRPWKEAMYRLVSYISTWHNNLIATRHANAKTHTT